MLTQFRTTVPRLRVMALFKLSTIIVHLGHFRSNNDENHLIIRGGKNAGLRADMKSPIIIPLIEE